MQLPKAVQDAVKNSESLQNQLNEEKPKAQEGTTPPPEGGTPEQAQDTLPPAVDPQTDPAVSAPPIIEANWQQKYLTLQGKFNSEVPRLQRDIQKLQGHLSALETENRQFKDAATQQKPENINGDPSPLDRESLVEYGTDFGAVVDTIEQLRSDNATLKAELKTISGSINQDRQAKSQEKYDSYMSNVSGGIAKLGGNFQVLNSDQNFLNWLRQYPDGEAEARHSKLLRAESNQDVTATIDIFTEYLRQTPQQGQQNQPPPPNPTNPPNLQPSPTPPTPPPVQQQAEGRRWTRAEISRFFKDKTTGVFKGREEEATALEADIHAAAAQGRVS